MMATFGCFRSQVQKGLSKADVRRAYRRWILSGSTIFAIIQIVMLVLPLCQHGHVSLGWNVHQGENPMLGPPLDSFDEIGARNAARILYDNEWWRLITPMYLHAGWFHLLGNLACQMRMGLVLECLWGSPIWIFIFLASGIYANIASCICIPDGLGVGSSGALCGIIGAWLPFILITWNQTLPHDRKKRNMELSIVLLGIAILVPTSFCPMTDYAAHLGGLVMGAALSTTVFALRLQDAKWRWPTLVIGVTCSVSLMGISMWWLLTKVHPSKKLLHA
jgi:membrane associated rhomboid family serine protease